MRLEGFSIHSFPPFAPQTCELGGRGSERLPGDVHILVGENGTGKTRLLSLFLAALGNDAELKQRVSGVKVEAAVSSTYDASHRTGWSSNKSTYKVPKQSTSEFLTKFREKGSHGLGEFIGLGHQTLDALLGNSTAMSYSGVAAIHDEPLKPMTPVEKVARTQFLTLTPPPKDNATVTQSLANMKIRVGMYLAGTPDGNPDRTTRMVSRLEQTLTRITGRRFIFIVQQEGTDIRLTVNWGGVRMRLQQMPDGLRSIVGWLASCVTRLDAMLQEEENPLNTEIILLLDEPEMHLHPAWQRQVLPALQAMLPQAQIIVTTHSPFVVSSVNHGWVYVLKADTNGVVKVELPRPCQEGDTYLDALEDVLGVKEWYDPETEGLLAEFRQARNAAVHGFAEQHKSAMQHLAERIAQRSDSLRDLMGREMAQFTSQERTAMQARNG